MAEFTMLEENVHRFPKRVVEDLDDFLMNEGMIGGGLRSIRAVRAGQGKSHSPPPPGGFEGGPYIGVAFRGTKSHHHVVRPDNRIQPRAEGGGKVESRQSAFAHDDRMNELHRDVLRDGPFRLRKTVWSVAERSSRQF